mgnify:CR=1 FL=1
MSTNEVSKCDMRAAFEKASRLHGDLICAQINSGSFTDCEFIPPDETSTVCGDNNDEYARCLLHRMRHELTSAISSLSDDVPQWCTIASLLMGILKRAKERQWERQLKDPPLPQPFATKGLDHTMISRLYRDLRLCLSVEMTWKDWCYWLSIFWDFTMRHPQINQNFRSVYKQRHNVVGSMANFGAGGHSARPNPPQSNIRAYAVTSFGC